MTTFSCCHPCATRDCPGTACAEEPRGCPHGRCDECRCEECRCGRLDNHEPHEWSVRRGETWLCVGRVVIEGGAR